MNTSSRRRFLQGTGLAAFTAALGIPIPQGRHFPAGLTPVALGAEPAMGTIPGKRGVRVLSDRPINCETPVTLLDDELTPNHVHFVRTNGHVPPRAINRSLEGWSLTIDGEIERPLSLSLDALKRYPVVERALVVECAGNGRAAFHPPASGNQWTLGAVGCALYRGVRLRDVLADAGVKSSAVYLAYFAEDPHLSGDASKDAISRGVPIAKAMDEHTLLTWEMNGEPLPALHGFPLRLICPGWPGSTSGKWLKRLWIRDRAHDGAKMTGDSYRFPRHPVAPGSEVPNDQMEIIEELPVKSIITFPGTGIEHPQSTPLALRGHAWSGFGDVGEMHLSIDFGQTWQPAELKSPRNRYAWQRWNTEVRFPTTGYFEVWARATDVTGRMQPMLVPGWNPKGYCNNAMQRIAIKVV
jgi:DMSO/TMAO reductase YedYZ molybdopterin-dependent catalytic subunit